MRKWFVRSLVLLLLAGGVIFLKFWVLAPDPVAVRVHVVDRGRVEEGISNSKAGTVKVRRRARLTPEIGGRIVAVLCQKGQRVETRDPLVRLNDDSQRAQILLARHQLNTARALEREAMIGREAARRELDRNLQLARKSLISDAVLDQYDSAYDRARAAVSTASARVGQARAQLLVAEAELRKTVIRAPFAGIVSELNVEVGEWVAPALLAGLEIQVALELLDPTSLYVSAPMDEVDSARVRSGLQARVSLDPYPSRKFDGEVVRVAPYVRDVESQNRTVEVEVALRGDELASNLLPGVSADVEIILDVHEDAIRLPTQSLMARNEVLVIDGRTLVARPVEVGLRSWDFVEILSGVAAGEAVVVSLDRTGVKAGAFVVVENP